MNRLQMIKVMSISILILKCISCIVYPYSVAAMKHYETMKVVPLDVQFEDALLVTSIRTDNISVSVEDFLQVESDSNDFYFEPDFK